MKKDIAEYVANCANCQQDKAVHLKPCCLTPIMEVPSWKWKPIKMDFVVGIFKTTRQHESI